jgi:hypothetical protein
MKLVKHRNAVVLLLNFHAAVRSRDFHWDFNETSPCREQFFPWISNCYLPVGTRSFEVLILSEDDFLIMRYWRSSLANVLEV